MPARISLRPGHEENLLRQLLTELTTADRRRPAHRLWLAAREVVQDPLRSLFEEVERDYPSKVRTAEHWAVLVDRLEAEAEKIAHCVTWGETPFITTAVAPRLTRFAAMNAWELKSAAESWGVEGNAIREALYELRIPLRGPWTTKPCEDVIDICELCWRTATPTERGLFYCATHAKFTNDYKHAFSRRTWRHRSQGSDDRVSFVWHWARRLKRKLPYALQVEPQDLSPLGKLCRGEHVPPDAVPDWRVPIGEYWEHFRRTRRRLQRARAKVDLNEARSVLKALDPPVSSRRNLQRRMHELLAIDHRLFFDRLIYVEACLEADARRRRRDSDPETALRSATKRHVVPYTYSYRGADRFRVY
jgi:hypothetical protein